jgi:hypothetical protein
MIDAFQKLFPAFNFGVKAFAILLALCCLMWEKKEKEERRE